MKKLLFLLALLVVSPVSRSADEGKTITFDRESYTLGWVDASNGTTTNEFYLPGEKPEDWTRMIGIRHFSGARQLKDAVNPWMAMVKPLIAAKPDAYEGNSKTGGKGVIIVVWLLSPDKKYYEYDMMRFVETPDGVMSYQFAEKLPFAKKLDVSATMKSLDERLDELKAFAMTAQTEMR